MNTFVLFIAATGTGVALGFALHILRHYETRSNFTKGGAVRIWHRHGLLRGQLDNGLVIGDEEHDIEDGESVLVELSRQGKSWLFRTGANVDFDGLSLVPPTFMSRRAKIPALRLVEGKALERESASGRLN